MASQEYRDMEYRQERAQAAHLSMLARLGPEYCDDEPEQENDYDYELDAYYDDLADQARYRIVCDGPELDEPVVISTRR